jgi:glycosyltransferase involved in cell wall biosynthesis
MPQDVSTMNRQEADGTRHTRPLLSVLIPTWNRSDLVLRAIESVGTVSPDIEIVVVDNASDEPVFARLQHAIVGHTNVRLFRNERNLGMVKNWNACIVHASGEWIGLLCSDDRYRAQAIARVVPLLRSQTEPTLVIQDPLIEKEMERSPAGRATVHDLRLPIASGNFWHRKMVEQLGGFDERFEYSADAEFWYRLAYHFPVVKVRDAFAEYNQHGSNYMWDTWQKPDFLDQVRLLRKTVLSYDRKQNADTDRLIAKEVDQAVWDTLLTIIGQTFLKQGRSELFSRYLRLAFQETNSFRKAVQVVTSLLYAIAHRAKGLLYRSHKYR